MIAERKAIGPIELCAILRRVKHWFVEQVWVAPNQKALVSTIRVFTANLQVMKHVLEYIHRRLRIEEESKVSPLGHCIRASTKYVRQVNLTEINLWTVAIVYRSSIQTEDFYFIFWSVNAYSNLLFELN